MKILVSHRLVYYIVTYYTLSCFVIFLAMDVSGVSGKSETKTKLLLQNIKTHSAKKVDEFVRQKECDSELTICKSSKSKEKDEKKIKEIPSFFKTVKRFHKPFIKIISKEVIQPMEPKAYKGYVRKIQKEKDTEKQIKNIYKNTEIDSKKENGKSYKDFEKEKFQKKLFDKIDKTKFKFLAENKNISKIKTFKNLDVQPAKEINADIKNISKLQDSKILKKIKKFKEDKKPGANNQKIAIIKKIEDESKFEKAEKKKTEKKKTRKKEVKKEKETKNDLKFSDRTFIFVLDSDEVKNDLCRKHSQIYLKQLEKYKMWALMMYDASAKLPSGILQGNANQYGDFDECLSINAVFKNSKLKSKDFSGIKGKYCLANVDILTNSENNEIRNALNRVESFSFIRSTILDPAHFIPRFSSISWGLCVPSTCLAVDVEKFMKSQIAFLNETFGLIFNIEVQEENCVVKNDLKFEFKLTTSMTIFFYFVIIGTATYATYLDTKIEKTKKNLLKGEITQKKSKEAVENINRNKFWELKEVSAKFSLQEKIKSIIMAFSFKRNMKKLLNDTESRDCIECINGIKSVCSIMLYFAHKTIPLGTTAFSNRIFLTKISNEATTIFLRTSIIYTDSFLLISGVLISYNLSKEISEKGKISWIKKSIARFIRLTPALFAVILFYAYVWEHMSSGPMWNLLVKKNSELCQKYMWRNLFYIQNFFAFEKMCAPQTHQLAIDMQLSLLAPVFVYFLYKYGKIGVGILQALFLLSSIMRYISSSNNNLSIVIYHGMPVSQLYKTANLLYTQSLHRASPYLLGTIVGYYLKKFEKQLNLSKTVIMLGWFTAFCLGYYSVISPSNLAFRNYKYDVHEASKYAALSPFAWSLTLAWFIIACHLGYGGKINEFLCQKIFKVFSRISYSFYLIQFLFFFYKVGIKRIPEMFTFSGSFDIIELLTVIAISVIISLLFDLPMMEIKRIVLDESIIPSKLINTVESIQSEETEASQIEDDSISQEDSQENTDNIDYLEEEIVEEDENAMEEELEVEGEEGHEENIYNAEEIKNFTIPSLGVQL